MGKIRNPLVDVDHALIGFGDTLKKASRRRDRETAALRKMVAAVGIERWGQRAGRLAALLEKHTVAVSRWVAEAARQRQDSPEYEEELKSLDEKLSNWALDAQERGLLKPPNTDK